MHVTLGLATLTLAVTLPVTVWLPLLVILILPLHTADAGTATFTYL